jgi:hypothetical protein
VRGSGWVGVCAGSSANPCLRCVWSTVHVAWSLEHDSSTGGRCGVSGFSLAGDVVCVFVSCIRLRGLGSERW